MRWRSRRPISWAGEAPDQVAADPPEQVEANQEQKHSEELGPRLGDVVADANDAIRREADMSEMRYVGQRLAQVLGEVAKDEGLWTDLYTSAPLMRNCG